MNVFISILILIAALLLIGVVLIQKSKGGGLASGFSGANTAFGVKTATTFVEKATWSLAAFIAVLSIISAIIAPKAADADAIQSQQQAKTEQAATAFPTEGSEKAAAPAAEKAPAATPAPAPAK